MKRAVISNEKLKQIRDRLTSDCIDDPEELLLWLATDGVKVINELLAYREGTHNVNVIPAERM